MEKQTDELDGVEEDLKGLKSFLYARFGQSINLEEDKWKKHTICKHFEHQKI